MGYGIRMMAATMARHYEQKGPELAARMKRIVEREAYTVTSLDQLADMLAGGWDSRVYEIRCAIHHRMFKLELPSPDQQMKALDLIQAAMADDPRCGRYAEWGWFIQQRELIKSGE